MRCDAKLLDLKVNFNMKDFNLVSGVDGFVYNLKKNNNRLYMERCSFIYCMRQLVFWIKKRFIGIYWWIQNTSINVALFILIKSFFNNFIIFYKMCFFIINLVPAKINIIIK